MRGQSTVADTNEEQRKKYRQHAPDPPLPKFSALKYLLCNSIILN
jgi:hypothetical protein